MPLLLNEINNKMQNQIKNRLVQMISIALVLAVALSCARPAYKTAKGKKKMKYYNSLQYK